LSCQRTKSSREAGTTEEKMGLVLGTDMSGQEMAGIIRKTAAAKVHRLAAYLVDGAKPVNPAQFDGIMNYLARCPDLPGPRIAEETMAPTAAAQPAQEPRAVISDIPEGFYATPSRTGHNDLDFWKVHVTGKGYRKVKRVIGGGDEKYPRLLDISNQEGGAALGAILRTGISKAREDYADNQRRCMRCGLHLTDEDSRAARMGPVCREK
jgi:Family of unknown function (DUF6011)